MNDQVVPEPSRESPQVETPSQSPSLADISGLSLSNEALRESEQRFELFMQHLPGLAWIKDAAGRYVYANAAAEKTFGMSRSQLYGKTDDEVFTPATANQFKANDHQALVSPAGIQTVESLAHADGSVHYSLVNKFPIAGPTGAATLVGGVAIDVTERLRAEETIRKISHFREAVIRTAAEGICVCREIPEYPYVRFSVWNDHMTELTGYTLAEINHLGWYQSLYPDPTIRQQAIDRMAAMREGNDLRNEEWEITRKDGECRIIAISTSVVENEDGLPAVVAMIQDVSERKRAVATQQQRLQELTVLNRVGEICSQATTADEVLRQVTELIAGTFFPDNCGFLLVDVERQVLVTHPSFVLSDPTVSRADKPLGVGITGQVALTGQPLRVAEVSQEALYLAADSRTRSELCVPIKMGETVFGVLNVESQKPSAFSAADEQLLTTVVEFIGNSLQRLQAERQQQENKERFRLIAELASSFSYHAEIAADLQINFHWVSGKFYEVTGYHPAELSGWGWLQLIPLADRPAVMALVSGLGSLQDDLSRPLDVQVLTRNGETRWVRSMVQPVWPRQPEGPVTVYGAVLDITEQKRSEQELQFMQFCVDHAGDAVFRLNREGQILYVNDAACADRGYTRDELLGMMVFDLDPDFQPAVWEPHFAELKRQGTLVFETRHRTKSGRVFPIEVSATYAKIGNDEFNFAFVRDISERKIAEGALRENEERFRLLFEGASDAIFWADAATGILTNCNRAAEALLGRDRSEIIGQSQAFLHPPEEVARYRALFEEHVRLGSSLPVEAEILHKNGHRVVVSISPSVTMIGGRAIIQGIFRDITKRKQAEANLRDSETRLRLAMEATNLGLWDWDVVTNTVIYSPEWKRQLGYDDHEVPNRYEEWERRLHPDDFMRVTTAIRAYLAGTLPEYNVEFRLRHKDGSYRWIYTRGVAIQNEQGQRIRMLGCHVDITDLKHSEEERRKLEAQILHTQKLESLGVLAGGIAHDFNNLLTVMLTYSSLAQRHISDESPVAPMLGEIKTTVQRAADLTRQLLAYAGKGTFVVDTLRLDHLVREMHDLLQTIVSKKATVELALQPATINGDASQIRQIVMNLLTNASDALSGQGGTIRLGTGVRYYDAEYLRSAFSPAEIPAGMYAFVEVRDTGCGMNAETLHKVFDPFFTTKFTGRGLGMAAVLGIVRSHQGTIKVASSLNQGTVFEVLFPASTEVVGDRTEQPDIPLHGSGSVLIVDDEPQIREATRRVFADAGFDVYTADDGQHGLEVFAEHSDAIVVVVLDLTMPRMDGLEFLRQLRQVAPRIPVMVMSGYSETEVSTQFAGMGVNDFIQKPFEPFVLVARVCQLVQAVNG